MRYRYNMKILYKLYNFKNFITSAVVLAAMLLTVLPQTASAQLRWDDLRLAQAKSVEVSATSAVVMDQVSGEVLSAKNATQIVLPASTVKLVTALVFLDQKLPSNTMCELLPSDAQVGGKVMSVKRRALVPWRKLMETMLVDSSNDLAEAMARCSGLPRDVFIVQMNSKAISQGALVTNIVDVTGLSAANTTTADNLALVARAAFSTEQIRTFARLRSSYFCYGGVCKTLASTNELLAQPALGILGGKTGYVDEGGYNLVVSAKRAGRYYIVGVFGASTRAQSFADVKKLIISL